MTSTTVNKVLYPLPFCTEATQCCANKLRDSQKGFQNHARFQKPFQPGKLDLYSERLPIVLLKMLK